MMTIAAKNNVFKDIPKKDESLTRAYKKSEG